MPTNFPSKFFTNGLISAIVMAEPAAVINGPIKLPADSIKAASNSACKDARWWLPIATVL